MGIVGLAVGVAALAGRGGNEQVEGAQQMQLANEVKPVPPTPIAIKKAELDQPTWDPAWDVMIEKALPEDLLSRAAGARGGDTVPAFPALEQGRAARILGIFLSGAGRS